MEGTLERKLSLDVPIDGCIFENLSPMAPREKVSRLKYLKKTKNYLLTNVEYNISNAIQNINDLIKLNLEFENEQEKESEVELLKYKFRLTNLKENIVKKQTLEYVNNISDLNLCDHQYVNDYIDITPEKSQRICYCIHCFESKS